MSKHIAPHTCIYIGPSGAPCGRHCWEARCSYHKKSAPYSPCGVCSKFTRSKYGLCRDHSGSIRTKESRKSKADPTNAASECGGNCQCVRERAHQVALDSAVDEILSWDWGSSAQQAI